MANNATYGYDDFNVGGVSIHQMHYIAEHLVGTSDGREEISYLQTEFWNYTLGLGLPENLAAKQDPGPGKSYRTFIEEVQSLGRIQSNSYSLVRGHSSIQ